MRRRISTGSEFERDFAYSRAVVQGEWCFVSGTTGYDYATMTMPEGAAAQAEAALATIGRTLRDAGFAFEDVVRSVVYLVDPADHVKGLLGQRITLAVDNHLEAANGLLQRHIATLGAGEDFGHVEGLREEALDLARAGATRS